MKNLFVLLFLTAGVLMSMAKKDCLLEFQIEIERIDRIEAQDSEDCPSGPYSAVCTTEVEAAHSHGVGAAASISTDGCLIASERALARRVYPDTELIHHSDRGCQYCSAQYVEVLKNAGINISMTQNGSPYENPLADRVNGQLKVEYDLDQIFESLPKARAVVLTTIQKYKEYRPH